MISVIEMLLNAVEKKGNYTAVKDERKAMTYLELLSEVYHLSQKIDVYVPEKKQLILIITEKTCESVVAMWGVACSGNYYAALDSKTPKDRFEKIIHRMKPVLIIYTNDKQKEKLKTDILSVVIRCNCESNVQLSTVKSEMARKHIISLDPLYMVFTSGSTGEPKAIVKSHQSMLAFAESFVSEFHFNFDTHEIFGNQASFDFDVSAKDIYISACIGATLCLIPHYCFLVPKKLAPYLSENHVSTLIWAASAIKFIKKFDCLKDVQPISIKKVFFSGECVTGECISYWKHYLPHTDFVNLYAPSEVTGNCLYHIVTNDNYVGILPLDKTFPNIEVLILNDDKKVVQDGEKGEIYVRGAFLAQGYYDNTEQTKEHFIQNPLHNHYPDIVYQTGDYVMKRGTYLYFSGRVDNQIKHMGHRIELEEIEAGCYGGVIDCGNLCAVYDEMEEKIVLLTDNAQLSYENLVIDLKNRIPKYMIPHSLLYVDNIPQNTRGKIDRKETKKMYEVMKNA